MELRSTPLGTLRFDEESSLLHITIRKEAMMDLKNLEEHYRMIETITKGRKHVALVDVSQPYYIYEDGIKYACNAGTTKNRVAAAYYNPTLSNRLNIMNLQQCLGGRIPTFIATEKEIALKWLGLTKI